MFVFLSIVNFRVDFVSGRYICEREKGTFKKLVISVLIKEILKKTYTVQPVLCDLASEQ
jgi:hypothetical protein